MLPEEPHHGEDGREALAAMVLPLGSLPTPLECFTLLVSGEETRHRCEVSDPRSPSWKVTTPAPKKHTCEPTDFICTRGIVVLILEPDCLGVTSTLPAADLTLSVPVFPRQEKVMSCNNVSTLAGMTGKTEGDNVYDGLGTVKLSSLLFPLL